MTKNLKYAFRNIKRNKVNSIITITGLSVAFASLLLIFVYVSQEFGFNTFHAKKDQLYRVNYSIDFVGGRISNSSLIKPEFSKTLKENVPQVKFATAYSSAQKQTLTFNNQNLEEELSIAEPDFFNMFSFELLFGNRNQLLTSPNDVVLTKNLAQKLASINMCSIQDILGQTLTFMNTGDQPFVIAGILNDIPKNSTLQFSALIPLKFKQDFTSSSNMFGTSSIFYEVDKNANLQVTNKSVGKTLKSFYADFIKRMQGYNVFAKTEDCFRTNPVLFKDTHLFHIRSDYETNNTKTSLNVLLLVGLLIILVAIVNFIMLSVGQSFKKIGETGIRNTLGARRIDIFNLFFFENLLQTFFAFVLGFTLFVFLIPTFSRLAPSEIFIKLIEIPKVTLFIVGCILIATLVTSTIPTLKMGKLQPNLLSSKKFKIGKKGGLTPFFVSFQYGLSILLIVMTITILRQTQFMKHQTLGFSSENIIDLRIFHLSDGEKHQLNERLKNEPGITNYTYTDRNFTGGRSTEGVKKSNGEGFETRVLHIDPQYLSTLKLELIYGNNFNEVEHNNLTAIVNQQFLTTLELDEHPIGQSFLLNGESYNIKGVVKDFHFDSMKENIYPLMLRQRENHMVRSNFILLQFHPQLTAQVLPFIRKAWKEVAPGKELDLKFWDEQLYNRYKAEEQWGQIIGFAALIAIIISSLGLFGLTVMLINARKKEIGIRKVNGAKVSEILSMLNKDFVKWVVIAFVIALPIAWFVVNKWLENFAYKTELSWWIFALAGVLAMGIALLTVSFQSLRAATRNPVEALRYE